MVGDRGILYTIEGIAAGILMITTAYLIISTTAIITPGDTHITDMQMEQLGNDILAVMDMPRSTGSLSPLEEFIQNHDRIAFRNEFNNLSRANSENWKEDIKFNATVYYRNELDGKIYHYNFSDSGTYSGTYFGRERIVAVTRRVMVTNATTISNLTLPNQPDNRNQSILLEVLLWRD